MKFEKLKDIEAAEKKFKPIIQLLESRLTWEGREEDIKSKNRDGGDNDVIRLSLLMKITIMTEEEDAREVLTF